MTGLIERAVMLFMSLDCALVIGGRGGFQKGAAWVSRCRTGHGDD